MDAHQEAASRGIGIEREGLHALAAVGDGAQQRRHIGLGTGNAVEEAIGGGRLPFPAAAQAQIGGIGLDQFVAILHQRHGVGGGVE